MITLKKRKNGNIIIPALDLLAWWSEMDYVALGTLY
jgi:hypothetical protein